MFGDIAALELQSFELGKRGAERAGEKTEKADTARKIDRIESERIAEEERWMAAVWALEFERIILQQREEIDSAVETQRK
jgi:hypothetical protein